MWWSQRGHKWRHNIAYTRCMLAKQGYTRTLMHTPGHKHARAHTHTEICNTCCFSTPEMIRQRVSTLHYTHTASLFHRPTKLQAVASADCTSDATALCRVGDKCLFSGVLGLFWQVGRWQGAAICTVRWSISFGHLIKKQPVFVIFRETRYMHCEESYLVSLWFIGYASVSPNIYPWTKP